MSKVVVANWKANPVELGEAKQLFEAEDKAATQYDRVATVICPPFVFLEELSSMQSGMQSGAKLGAQDVSSERSGPYTGEVSIDMLKEFGVSHVLVGHSERRKLGETDEIINKKMKLLIESDIIPILLVGESEKNDTIRQDVLVDQLSRALEGLTKEQVAKIISVYEPVWAISTNANAQADNPDETVEAIKFMQGILKRFHNFTDNDTPPILYGGSVNKKNAAAFFEKPEIAGAVVGGASLRSDEFANILKIANESR